jgi:hypothetical protein
MLFRAKRRVMVIDREGVLAHQCERNNEKIKEKGRGELRKEKTNIF